MTGGPDGQPRRIATTSSTSSLWLTGAPQDTYPALQSDIPADVAVVGGGIAGLTTALRLQQEGAAVVLLEAASIGLGVTGNTTAKVTALQSTVLSTIVRHHDAEAAATYAAASAAAVDDVAALVAAEDIDCALERRPAVTYAAKPEDVETAAGEYEAATAAGLPVQWRDDDAGLPYPVAGAVWLQDQLVIQPVQYVHGLAAAFVRAGGRLFEDSRVLSVGAGSLIAVKTAAAQVTAGQVVIATHFPILDRGVFFARMEPQRSYCIAARVTGELPRAMSISVGERSRSVQWFDGQLIVGGEGHSAGAADVGPDRYQALERFADEHWGVTEATARWSAQDPVPYDHLPMIGPLVPRSSNVWVATGWAKWGLTGGTFAARILADAVAGREHEWAPRFTPSRLSLKSTPEVAKLGAKFSALMAVDRVTPAEVGSADEVPIGEARVVRHGLGKAGVFRDDAGGVHAVSLRCTHLGCLLRFNGAERSWDCPCHGSRFDVDGAVLEGPAVRPLEPRDVSGSG